MNHSSNDHPWFIASAADDPYYENWYRWSETNPGYNGPWGQPVWHYHNSGEYFYGLFWSGMPDLNYENPAVKTEIFDIAEYWLDDMGVDGFRCDAVKYIYEDGNILENTDETLEFWEDFHEHYKSVNPEAVAVGEAWDSTVIVLEYVDNKFDFCFEFDLASSILNSVQSLSPLNLRSQMSEIKDLYPYHQYATFLTNHDQNRVFDVLGEDLTKTALAGAVYLTLPGIPFIYYGEEIAMKGSKPDPDIRRPMQWSSAANGGFTTGSPWHQLNSNYDQFNVEDMQADGNSIWSLYRELIELRSNEQALSIGTYQAVSSGISSVYTFIRQYEDEAVVVMINFAADNADSPEIDTEITNLTPGEYSVLDILQENQLADLTIGENGEINGWNPVNSVSGQSISLLKLTKL
jgi:glycosidase